MVKLRNLIPTSKLREYTHLKSICQNATRWSSTYAMLRRYLGIHSCLSLWQIDGTTENDGPETKQDDDNWVNYHIACRPSFDYKIVAKGWWCSTACRGSKKNSNASVEEHSTMCCPDHMYLHVLWKTKILNLVSFNANFCQGRRRTWQFRGLTQGTTVRNTTSIDQT